MKYITILMLILLVEAKGQIVFVNKTTETIHLALTSYDGVEWTTNGWYRIDPLQKWTAVSKPTNRYYYYYAISESKTWSDNYKSIWIHTTNAFTTKEGLRYNAAEGYKVVGTKIIDLGNEKTITIELDLKSDIIKQIESYLKRGNLDSIEGLYTISDDIFIDYSGFFSPSDKKVIKNHWAKVAIIRDTINLSRNYAEYVLEAEGFSEGDIRADFLRIRQGTNLFISDQVVVPGEPAKSFVFEYLEQDGIFESKFSYVKGYAEYRVKRTYLKFFPQK